MPILYIHGVATRSRDGFLAMEPYVRRLVAPAIAADPDNVLIDDVFWGDLAASFAWDGASRPRSRLLGMGAAATPPTPVEGTLTAAAFANVLSCLPASTATAPSSGGLISGSVAPTPAISSPVRLRDLPADALSDLLAMLLSEAVPDPAQRAHLSLAADSVAHDPSTPAALAAAGSEAQALAVLLEHVRQRAEAEARLVGMGLATWVTAVRDRLGEALSRGQDLPTYALSVATAELRPPLNTLVSTFLGDVFVYLRNRGTAARPGAIPQRLLSKLALTHQQAQRRGGEPLVLLSHSMGGQIVYDALTHFLPGNPAWQHLRIDFWCATASQVGFFEELKLFLASAPHYHRGHPVPFPAAHLGAWWNVWDHNDFLSYTVQDIMAQVDDAPYDSGMSLLAAHSGYLQRPSFYRALAAKLRTAAAQGWRT